VRCQIQRCVLIPVQKLSILVLLLSVSGAAQTLKLTATPTTGSFGQTVTLTATLTGANQPTGIVNFRGNGVAIGRAHLINGIATLTTILPRGLNSYTASYRDDLQSKAIASSPVSVKIVVPLSALTGNNTSACPASGPLPVHCQQQFSGQTDTRSGVETVNFDPIAGNVSDEDPHSYLHKGYETKILANFMAAFCMTNPNLNKKTNTLNCHGNVLTGYQSNDKNTVAAQVLDLARRHIDGAMITWASGGSSDDQTALDFQSYIEKNFCNGPNDCSMNYSIQLNEVLQWPFISVWTGKRVPGCVAGHIPTNTDALFDSCVVSKLENDMCYLNAAHFGSKAFLKINGHPVIQVFTYESSKDLPNNGPGHSWQDVWNKIADWNNNIAANCSGATYGGFNYKANNGTPYLVFGGQGGFSHTDSSGGFYWVMPSKPAPDNQNLYNITAAAQSYPTVTLDYFYQKATSTYSSLQNWGGAFKGFNEVQSGWGENRMIDEQCGMTWLQSLTESNKYYTDSALPYLQIETWNDYNEGHEIETGINNCYIVSASLKRGVLLWILNPMPGTKPNVATVSHIEIYDSPDGKNFTLLTSQAAATSGSYSLKTLPPGSHKLYVYMYGRNSILNQISNGVDYNN